MKRILAFALALFASSAFATLQLVPDNVNTNTNLNSANAMQGQLQGQVQGQFTNVDVSNRISNDTRAAASSFAAGGLGVGQGGVGQAVSGGSTSNVDFNITSPKNTPAVFSGNVYPTAPCMGSSTVGGAGVGFGFSVGTSWKDDECGIRETARSFQGMGLSNDALKVLCTSAYAAAAPSCAVATTKE
jgi:hypothetical protein